MTQPFVFDGQRYYNLAYVLTVSHDRCGPQGDRVTLVLVGGRIDTLDGEEARAFLTEFIRAAGRRDMPPSFRDESAPPPGGGVLQVL